MTRSTRLIRAYPRPSSGGTVYDNTESGMTADNVQDAIDELAQGGPAIHGIWRFDTSTSAADPGTGDVRFNNATPASVTNIYISQTNRPGSDCGRVFEYITDGTPILFQQRTDAAAFLKVTVDGTPTDNGAWWTIPVTVVDSGTLPTANADVSVVLFIGGGGGGGTLDVTDGTTTVSPTTEIEFDSADFEVTDQGGGSALVEFIGSASPGSGVGCIVSGTSTALTNGAYVSLAFGSADTYDPDGFHDPSSSNAVITVPTGLGGIYILVAYSRWPSNASGNTDRRLAYRVNGGSEFPAAVGLDRQTYSVSSATTATTITDILSLAQGDTVEIRQWTGINSQTADVYGARLFRIA